MSFVRILPFVMVILMLCVAPFMFAEAQIVPCDGVKDDLSTDAGACTICHLGQLASNILNSGIALAVLFSALMFAYAGFLYITTQVMDKKTLARKILINVTIGLIIMLGSWLFIDSVIRTLVGDSEQLQKFGRPWYQVCANVAGPGAGPELR